MAFVPLALLPAIDLDDSMHSLAIYFYLEPRVQRGPDTPDAIGRKFVDNGPNLR